MKRVFAILLAVLAALPLAAAAQEYRIKPGDVLAIEVLEDSALNRTALVQPDGRISFPLAGTVAAAGRTVGEVQAALADSLTPNFATRPNVFVALQTVAVPPVVPRATGPVVVPTIDVYVMGEVENPGKRQIEPGTTLLQFLAEIGGFTRFAATKRIQLRRTDAAGVPQVYSIDYNAIERGAALSGNTTMAEGDVIVVPQRRLFE